MRKNIVINNLNEHLKIIQKQYDYIDKCINELSKILNPQFMSFKSFLRKILVTILKPREVIFLSRESSLYFFQPKKTLLSELFSKSIDFLISLILC